MQHDVYPKFTSIMNDMGIVSNLPIYGMFGYNTVLLFKNTYLKSEYIKSVRSMYEHANQLSNFYYMDGNDLSVNMHDAFSNILSTYEKCSRYHLFIDNFEDTLFYPVDCFAREIVDFLSMYPNICPHFLISTQNISFENVYYFKHYVTTSTLLEC